MLLREMFPGKGGYCGARRSMGWVWGRCSNLGCRGPPGKAELMLRVVVMCCPTSFMGRAVLVCLGLDCHLCGSPALATDCPLLRRGVVGGPRVPECHLVTFFFLLRFDLFI